ncbi:metalloendopeptidase [Chitinophaga caeni]|uniref:Metalloendopeptidase n=1 Tax=Chitinophaga caeni TaxID=2029983 RepID=A0A291QQJ3_9BACT|nr:M23 family metallopeptidase [Chitinophaga caeni]ATL46206.1 metalloendopeptidase [Chitinophaga caeni]
MKRLFIGICLCCLPALSWAQSMPRENYPKDYFRNPLEIPIMLAGNFGELRPNHFHSGIDIKTQQRENLRVHAAADGYVSRVNISHTGFGHGLYITHPNGYTTVYAHLNEFYPELAEYVKQKQYAQESWAIDLQLPPGKFPVKKGDFVALSGNTGGSQGPHLHFEIRNTESEKPLNPMLFGFDIPDTRDPEIYRLAIYDHHKSIYEQTAKLLAAKRTANGKYSLSAPVVHVSTDQVVLGVGAIDRQSNSPNPNGIFEAVLNLDGAPQIGFQMDEIGYDETRYVNAHVDYKMRKSGGNYVQLLYALPGNFLGIYHDLNGKGVIDLSDRKVHPVSIDVMDAYGNTSSLSFSLQYNGAAIKEADCANQMYPDSRNIFENNQVEFDLAEGDLYDDICFSYYQVPSKSSQALSDVQHLHDARVPVHRFFNVSLKPTKIIDSSLYSKVVMKRSSYGTGSAATSYADGWFTARFRDLGNFHLELDTQSPKITLLGGLKQGANLSRYKSISFSMSDNNGIEAYRGEIDGKWVMFSRRSNRLTYTFDEHCPAGSGNHTLTMTVTDIVGNSHTYTYKFKR